MRKILSLLVTVLFCTSMFAADVFYVNSRNWGSVNVYTWNGDDKNANWPGVAMTKTSDKAKGFDVYSYEMPAGFSILIFNGDGSQTADLTFNAEKPYFYENEWYESLDAVEHAGEPTKVTLYFVNNEDWEEVYAYVFDGEGVSYSKWPGDKMTKTELKALEKDVYSFEFPEDYTTIIFNNNKGNQTADLVWNVEKPYFYSNKWYASLEEIKPAEPAYYLKNNWGGGADWTWLEMKKVLDDFYVLDTVFGGGGVNFSALESHADSKYIEAKDIPAFDREQKETTLGALDTVLFRYIPSEDSLFVVIIGKYVEPAEPTYYLKNNWGGEAEWTWKPLEKESEGVYSLKKVVFGGTGVNLNIAKVDAGSKFFYADEKEPNHIQGDKIQALDTVNFTVEIQKEQVIVTAELVARPTFRLENGFYLFGSPFDWKLENVTDAQKFVANTEAETEGEFVLKGVTLAEGDSLKVIAVENDIIKTWYGAGEGGAKNYGINAKQAGEDKEVYFNYNWKEAWNGHIWVGENIEPIVVKDLKLVPGVWASDNARLVVWAWGKEVEGAWSVFSGEGDTLVAKINEKADSVIFARLDPEKDIEWAAVWNKTINLLLDECGLFFVNTWDQYSWCEAAEPILPAKFYITGSANLVGEEKAWTPDALKVTEDSYTFEKLAAGKYQMKVVDANKENWYNIGDMSEVAAGLYRDQDANICFILAEEGDVKVTYKKEDEQTLFVLEGAFVAPEIQLMGINGWEAKDAIALEPAEDGKSASKTLELTGEWYDFKVVRAGEWLGKKNEGEQNYTIHSDFNWVDGLERDAEGVKSISLQPSGNGDYTFTYDFVSGKLTVTFPQAPEPVLANGYYLIGVINGAESTWNYASLKAENLFTINAAVETTEEYSLSTTLAENDEIQVVRCDNDALGAWYPGGEDKNYKVDAEHAGQVTIYFRPNRDGGDDWWEKCFFVASDEPSGVENTNATVKAVKTLKDGQLIIEKNGKRYNVLGAIVR